MFFSNAEPGRHITAKNLRSEETAYSNSFHKMKPGKQTLRKKSIAKIMAERLKREKTLRRRKKRSEHIQYKNGNNKSLYSANLAEKNCTYWAKTPGRRKSARSRLSPRVKYVFNHAQEELKNETVAEPRRHKTARNQPLDEQKFLRSGNWADRAYKNIRIKHSTKKPHLQRVEQNKDRSNFLKIDVNETNIDSKRSHKKSGTSAKVVVLDSPTQPCCGSTGNNGSSLVAKHHRGDGTK